MDFQTCFSPTKCTSQKKDRLFPEDRSPQKYYPSPKFKKTSPKYNTDLYESLINQNSPDQVFIKSSPIREISSPKFKGKYTFLTNPNVHPVISLNVPSVSSDFYIHPIDWSKKDQICVTSDNSVYFFNSNNRNSKHILTNIEIPSSCGYSNDGNSVTIGTRCGNIYVINSNTFQAESCMQIYDSTISVIRNTSQGTLIGDQDGNILRFDSRCPTNLDVISAHESEVCNIAISNDGNHFATGSNENTVKIWDFRALSNPYSSYCEHSAAVRALSFSSINPDLIVSGGGTTDKTIRIWDINTCVTSKTVQTGSQICNLIWNERYDTILSTHGFSQNSICLWSSQLKLMNSIKIHKNRVLYSCSSPESTHVLTAAPHDKVYIWKLFPKHESMSVQQIFSLR
ncbi:WD repeat protein, putative [Trichomonas vaginalis G3]|uniref:WD repeat protein, putative n=1 Tax=Trichomonas vaginalis (strain ATCC PRA-98 / G3) TaxID=412133 RepID=A2EH42_TRIV3|nr:cell division cycle [Trichomonas vaginalis G3]EAY08010.1 WD repeat protein, putative [Trichomonas vaginalis G3]KAI5537370.1 cell division cycle [Trichomonas vaginalis G3]|eukprot:XP_001320233.1 WD repeat protein [Trichomonas vaginalis G3]